MLKPYKSLSKQAEEADTYEAYKELIEKMKAMNYEDLYDVMRDAETALKVLCRKENTCDIDGIRALTETIVRLGVAFLQMNGHPVPFTATITPEWKKPYIKYTYEFIEEQMEAKEV